MISNMKSDSLGLLCWGHHKLLLSGVALNEREDSWDCLLHPVPQPCQQVETGCAPPAPLNSLLSLQQIWALCLQPPYCRDMPGHCSGLLTWPRAAHMDFCISRKIQNRCSGSLPLTPPAHTHIASSFPFPGPPKLSSLPDPAGLIDLQGGIGATLGVALLGRTSCT